MRVSSAGVLSLSHSLSALALAPPPSRLFQRREGGLAFLSPHARRREAAALAAARGCRGAGSASVVLLLRPLRRKRLLRLVVGLLARGVRIAPLLLLSVPPLPLVVLLLLRLRLLMRRQGRRVRRDVVERRGGLLLIVPIGELPGLVWEGAGREEGS